MPVFGIICEFNPIHLGHQYLLHTAKEMGADTVVCVMSGNTTQRGEWATCHKYLRAEAAVRAGADLVLELPFPWCSSAAEGFARGGIGVLRHFADTVLFGSECGDLSLLQRAADVATSPDFRQTYQQALTDGQGAAKAYADCLAAYGIPPLSSNDLLGVAYLCAAKEQNADLAFQTVQRQGAAYRADTLSDTEFPSALAIRQLWKQERFSETERFLPKECTELFRTAIQNGELTSEKEWDTAWLSFFRLHQGTELAPYAGAEGGLANRICATAKQACDFDSWFQAMKTKRYTDAHIRRTMLACITGVPSECEKELPQYTTLLAMNEKGQELLSKIKRTKPFPIVTKPADAPKDTTQYRLTETVDGLFALSTKQKHPAAYMMTQKPYVQSKSET